MRSTDCSIDSRLPSAQTILRCRASTPACSNNASKPRSIECLDRLLSLGGVHPFEKAFDEGTVLQGMLCAPLVHRMRIAPLVTAVARLTIDSGAITRDSTS